MPKMKGKVLGKSYQLEVTEQQLNRLREYQQNTTTGGGYQDLCGRIADRAKTVAGKLVAQVYQIDYDRMIEAAAKQESGNTGGWQGLMKEILDQEPEAVMTAQFLLARKEIMASLVRSARLEDAATLAEVSVAAWRTAYRGHIPDDFLDVLSISERTAGWTRRLSHSETGHVLIVELGGRVAGFCVFGPSRDDDSKNQGISEIMALNIHPEHWRCGLGTLLCQHVLQQMSSEGSTAATLCGQSKATRGRDDSMKDLDSRLTALLAPNQSSSVFRCRKYGIDRRSMRSNCSSSGRERA